MAQIQTGLRELFALPADYQVVMGNGGATAFWAVATASLIRTQAAHAVFGSFGEKFYQATLKAPFLVDSLAVRGGISAGKSTPAEASPQTRSSSSKLAVLDQPIAQVDTYCWPHHETSTGVVSPVNRVPHADSALMVVDATSIAGAVPVDLSQVDAYYFSLQKAFASEGGLWVCLASPAALARAEEITRSQDRWIPDILDFHQAATNSAKAQTLNTPAISTLLLAAEQISWLQDLGGLAAAEARCRAASDQLYQWAEQHPQVNCYVERPAERSPVVVTLDLQDICAPELVKQLRANGILDLNPYRGIAENQIRIGCFPTLDPGDIEQLIACLDYLIERLV